jgi:hypothetical protein
MRICDNSSKHPFWFTGVRCQSLFHRIYSEQQVIGIIHAWQEKGTWGREARI